MKWNRCVDCCKSRRVRPKSRGNLITSITTTFQDASKYNRELLQVFLPLKFVCLAPSMTKESYKCMDSQALSTNHGWNHLATESPDDGARLDTSIWKELARDQLISNAVLQRESESALLLSPSIQTRIELDGQQPDLAFYLLDLHWNRQHFSFLLSHRPAIMDSLTNNGPYVNKLLLNAIYYSSCLHSDRTSLRGDPNDLQSMGLKFYRRFKYLLSDYIDQPSMPAAVALLLCGASLVSHGRQSAGWILCGTAYRMIIDLRCHLSMQDERTSTSTKASTIEFEIRNRVYRGAFMTDKFQSLYLGRPRALRSTDAKVPKEYLDTYEELEEWKPYSDPESNTSS
jgi:hypothetical protein